MASVLAGYDDDEITVRPWEVRLPGTVILAIARVHGFEPAPGHRAVARSGVWRQPMPLTRTRARPGAGSESASGTGSGA